MNSKILYKQYVILVNKMILKITQKKSKSKKQKKTHENIGKYMLLLYFVRCFRKLKKKGRKSVCCQTLSQVCLVCLVCTCISQRSGVICSRPIRPEASTFNGLYYFIIQQLITKA